MTEDGKIELEIMVEDENASVTWFHDQTELLPEKSRWVTTKVQHMTHVTHDNHDT